MIRNIYKVVVVDDEPMAVKAICRIIEKNCPQFEVVGTAGNGMEALEVIEKTAPDLLLTDIEMPLLNGLDLIRKVSETMSDICFVIISGYQDFEYVRTAIRQGVLDYLTKPLVPSQILATMKNVEEKLIRFYYDRRNVILRKLCIGESIVPEELQRFFPYKEFYAALIRENGLPRRYAPAKEPELYGTMEEVFSVYGRDNMEQMFLIPKEMLVGQSLLGYMMKVEKRQKTAGSYMTLLYYGNAFSRMEISQKIRDLYYWQNTLSTVGYSQSVDLDQKQLLSNRLPTAITTELAEVLPEISKYMKIGRLDQVMERIGREFNRWEQEKRPQIWVEQASRRILNALRSKATDEEALIEREYQLEDAFYYATDMKMLCENLRSLFCRLPDQEKERRKADSPEYFSDIEKYLQEHLSEPLSLQDISGYFAISQTYMSRLFRKYTGQSYNQYVTRIRIERAKQLIEENPELFVKDIAELVGYHDQFYFSRIFRSYTGKSPSEFQTQ